MRKRFPVLCFILLFTLAFSAMAFAAGEDINYGNITVSGDVIIGGDQMFTLKPAKAVDLLCAEGSGSVTIDFSGADDTVTLYNGSTKITSSSRITLPSNNQITLTVKVDDQETGVFVINVERASTGLAELEVRNGSEVLTLSPTFKSGTYYYSVPDMATSVSSLTVRAKANYRNAVVTIGGKEGLEQNVPIAQGDNNIDVVVSIPGSNVVDKHYLITVHRFSPEESNISYLKSLKLYQYSSSTSAYTYSPSFNKTTTTYSTTVPNSASYIKVAAVAEDPNAKITYTLDGNTINNPDKISLTEGLNRIYIEVEAPDGSTRSYRMDVTRSTTSDTRNANLRSLVASASSGSATWSKSFASDVTSGYTVTIPYSASSIRFKPTVEEAGATVTVAGYSVDSGEYSPSISVNAGSSKSVTIKVTAPNSSTYKTYTLTVKRASSSSSSNCDLDAIKIRNADSTGTTYTLNPTFDSDTNSYTVYVPYKTDRINLYATVDASGATMTLDGNTLSSSSWSSAQDLSTGSNTFRIKVLAPNASNSQTYTIKVYRAKSNASTDATLDSLVLRQGTSTSSTKYTLSPSFDEDTTSYTTYVSSSIDRIYLAADANRSDAVILVNGEYFDSSYTGIDLESGSNTITVKVYAPNYSTTKTYTIKVSRTSSSEDRLDDLIVKARGSSSDLINFKSGTTSYSFSVGSDVTYLNITPTAMDSSATVRLNGTTIKNGSTQVVGLDDGKNTITITVKAVNGDVTTYTLTVTKGSATKKTISLRVGSKTVLVNGASQTIDAAPFYYKKGNYDYTMVPIRFISEVYGATVDWEGTSKTVTIKFDGKTLTMKIGVTGTGMDVPPVERDGRTYVHVRYVLEQLGATVDWFGDTQEIRVSK